MVRVCRNTELRGLDGCRLVLRVHAKTYFSVTVIEVASGRREDYLGAKRIFDLSNRRHKERCRSRESSLR
eukprot:2799878-Prymnesium_polylepis.2